MPSVRLTALEVPEISSVAISTNDRPPRTISPASSSPVLGSYVRWKGRVKTCEVSLPSPCRKRKSPATAPMPS